MVAGAGAGAGAGSGDTEEGTREPLCGGWRLCAKLSSIEAVADGTWRVCLYYCGVRLSKAYLWAGLRKLPAQEQDGRSVDGHSKSQRARAACHDACLPQDGIR